MSVTLAPMRKNVSPIGLDLGHTAARAVQLCRNGRTWTLARAATWSLRPGGDSGTARVPHPSRVGDGGLGDRLRRALWHQDFVGRAFVAGLSQPDVELHALELPRPDEAKPDGRIESAARWEIERLTRFEGHPTQTAHWWLPPSRAARTTAIGVAVPQPTVKQIWDACCRAGARCQRVDVTACALCRAAVLLRPPSRDEVWGTLDLGARSTRLVLCVDEVPVLARSLDSGGQVWTDKIAASLQLSADGAELHKRDHGIRPARMRASSAGAARPVPDGPKTLSELAGMIFAALRPDLERIAADIERSYEYVLECYPGRQAADLILAGGGASLKKLDTYLADRLGIRVKPADAYLDSDSARLEIDLGAGRLREPISSYLGAIGLAVQPEGEA